MAKQKYVKGSFLLEENVDDSKAYYKQHKAKVDEVIAWANQLHIYVAFGLSANHTYLCEYEVFGQTTRMCKGVASELKSMLKPEWKGVHMGYQVEGHTLQ